MDAAAVNRHEADAPRGLRRGDVIDREPRGPVARGIFLLGRAHDLAELTLVIGLLVGELRGCEHVLGVDDEQQVVMGLQMDVPGPRRRGQVVHRARVLGVAYIDNAEALGEHVADIGVAAMHHDLHAIGPAALVGVADDAHVARVIRFRQVGHR